MRGIALAILGTLAACSAFGTSATTPVDGGAADAGSDAAPDAAPLLPRDLQITLDLPEVGLDPLRLALAHELVVKVADAGDPSAPREVSFPLPLAGPIVVQAVLTHGAVDVSVEVRGLDTKVWGYGEAKRAEIPAGGSPITVALRRRILYLSGLLGPSLRPPSLLAYDLALSSGAPLDALLPTLDHPVGLHATKDGRELLQVGGLPARAMILSTANHTTAATIDLPFAEAQVSVSLLGGRYLLVGGNKGQRVVALVDVAARSQRPIALTGGEGVFTTYALARSPDGTRVVGVAELESNAATTQHLLSFDVEKLIAGAEASPIIAAPVEQTGIDRLRAIRFTNDGTRILVGGEGGGIVAFDPAFTKATPLSTLGSSPFQNHVHHLFVPPNLPFAFISTTNQYTADYGPMRIIDVGSGGSLFVAEDIGGFSAFDLISAVVLPYAPRRVLGGQSDVGDNAFGPVVELDDDRAPRKVDVGQLGGNATGLATPFGDEL